VITMNNKTRILPALSILAALLLAWPSMAVAQPTNADFQQAVAAYQQAPSADSYAKVIKMAAATDQLPAVPEEARKHFMRGAALFKDAKSQDDFKLVSDEFSQAVRLAPWWPEALYNLALVTEAANDYAQSSADLKFYQLFKLSDAEARSVQDKIYGLEAKAEKAVKDKELAAEGAARDRELAAHKAVEDQRAQQQAAAANKARQQEEFLRKINGAEYIRNEVGSDKEVKWIYDVAGDKITSGYVILRVYDRDDPEKKREGVWTMDDSFKIEGRTLRAFYGNGPTEDPDYTGVISDDGMMLTIWIRGTNPRVAKRVR